MLDAVLSVILAGATTGDRMGVIEGHRPQAFSAVFALQPSAGFQLWMCLGCLNSDLGDHDESLKCFEIAHQFALRGGWEALYNKAIALERLGSYGEAAAILEDLIKKYPKSSKFLAERGSCTINLGYPHEALQYYQIAMRLWEQAPSVYEVVCIYSGLCTAYAELSLKEEAMEIAMEGLKKFPDEDGILYHNAGPLSLIWGGRKRQERC